LGHLGEYAALQLVKVGFKVVGWSRTTKHVDGVLCYGQSQLQEFASQTDILVCLLPLTGDTRGILNAKLFDCLPNHACLINVARGGHLHEADLLAALSGGSLRGACLDVFQQEPLPRGHAFWTNDRILITPHSSSVTDPLAVAPQIIENYRRALSGSPLLHQVDMKRGY